MPDYSAWYGSGTGLSTDQRAIAAWRRIQDKPFAVTLRRDGVMLSEQTVRLEYDMGNQAQTGSGGEASERGVVLFGVKDHPVQADFDVQRGDRFAVNYDVYEISDVVIHTGEIQAYGQRIQT